jgi:hypothetical protein
MLLTRCLLIASMPKDCSQSWAALTRHWQRGGNIVCTLSFLFSFIYDQPYFSLPLLIIIIFFIFLVEYITLNDDLAKLRNMAQKTSDTMSLYVKDRSGLSDKAVTFLARMFTHFYARPTAQDLLEDPFFAGLKYLLFYFFYALQPSDSTAALTIYYFRPQEKPVRTTHKIVSNVNVPICLFIYLFSVVVLFTLSLRDSPLPIRFLYTWKPHHLP